jgi:tRNA pseudouridine32 synthase/23S rRNA pseudouridine746 synthase
MEDHGYAILHADEHLLVVDKSCGLLTVPGIGPEKADCLIVRLQRRWPGARVVHRLDRDTSGVLVVALDAGTHRALSMQFERRETSKTYVALAAGHPPKDEGEIDLPLRKDLVNTPLQIVDFAHGRPSVTRWRVRDRVTAPDRTRFELTPITGRSHQLRVHLLTIGHPILGDDLYAPADVRAMARGCACTRSGWDSRTRRRASAWSSRHRRRSEKSGPASFADFPGLRGHRALSLRLAPSSANFLAPPGSARHRRRPVRHVGRPGTNRTVVRVPHGLVRRSGGGQCSLRALARRRSNVQMRAPGASIGVFRSESRGREAREAAPNTPGS